MDQQVLFKLQEKGKTISEADSAIILLSKEGSRAGELIPFCQYWGKRTRPDKRTVDAFHGTMRFVRKGKKIDSLCRDKGSSEWKEMNSCSCPDKDMFFGVMLCNWHRNRTSIAADEAISVTFENFKIGAAQGIVESDI
ncbi:MAG: hypothetical protein AB1512_04590 [Thermodesulfobacteriota bacterium]